MRTLGLPGFALLLASLLTGCAGDGGDGGGGGPQPCQPQVDPAAAPRFASNIQPIYDRSCSFPSCHSSVAPQEALDLSPGRAYPDTVGKRAMQRPDLQLVDPGDPDDSYLLKKVRGDPDIAGVLMPQGCPGTPLAGAQCLTADEIDAIATWILACAPNN